MIERDLAWASAFAHRVEQQAEVAAAPAEVWRVVVDHAGWAAWFPLLGEVRPGPGPSEGVGGRREVRTGPMRLDERFIAWEPERRFAFTGVRLRPPLLGGLVEDIRLEPVGGGEATRVTYAMSIELTGPLRLLQPALGRLARAALGRGLAGLARTAEAAPDPSTTRPPS